MYPLAQQSEVIKQITYDLPSTPLGWTALVGGFSLLIIYVFWMYLRDTRDLSFFWRGWLLLLRIGVIAGLFIIAISPQERTRKKSYKPSRVAILLDDSLSMRHPLDDFADGDSGAASAGLSRSDAVAEFLAESPLIKNLQEDHEVSVYTYSEGVAGPVRVFPSRQQQEMAQADRPRVSGKPGSEGDSDGEPDAKPESMREFWTEALRPKGLETQLGEAVYNVIDEVKGDQLAGMLVVGDGAFNAGRHPDDANEKAREDGVRLLTLGVGSTKPPKTLDIAGVQAPTDVRIGSPYSVKVSVTGQGLADARERQVKVTLMSRPEDQGGDYKLTDEKTVSLPESGTGDPIIFTQEPKYPGVTQYKVLLEPVTKVVGLSAGTRNYEFAVSVSERGTGVLLIAGGPLRDYRFLRNLLSRHPDIDLDVWLQSVEPEYSANVSQECDILFPTFPESFPKRPLEEKLPGYGKMSEIELKREAREYDVVMMFDPDWDADGFGQTPLERIVNVGRVVDWVRKDSGGLVLVAGDVYTPELTRLARQVSPEDLPGFDALAEKTKKSLRGLAVPDLYPVVLRPFLFDTFVEEEDVEPHPIRLTGKGKTADFLMFADTPEESLTDWQDFEGIYACYPTNGVKAGATVYAHYADFRENSEFGLPVFLASQFYGSGRTFYIGSPELWRTRALSEDHFDNFWVKLIQEAGQGRRNMGSSQSVSLTDKKFVLNRMVEIRARLQDGGGDPIVQDTAEVRVTLPDGTPLREAPRLVRAAGDGNETSDEFAAQFRATQSGQYRIEVDNPEDAEPLVIRLTVEDPQREDRNRQQNAKLLTDLTRNTGGAYFTLADASTLELKSADARMTDLDSGTPETIAEAAEGDSGTESAPGRLSISELLPNRGEEYWIDRQLVTLWDRSWLMYLLVGLLALEWLTRKLLRLA